MSPRIEKLATVLIFGAAQVAELDSKVQAMRLAEPISRVFR
jgi:hypothetical protein